MPAQKGSTIIESAMNPSCDLFLRETQFVDLGTCGAVVDAELQEVYGVAADRFLNSVAKCSQEGTYFWDQSSQIRVARFSRDQCRVSDGFDSSDLKSKMASCIIAAKTLEGDCDRLRNLMRIESVPKPQKENGLHFPPDKTGKITSRIKTACSDLGNRPNAKAKVHKISREDPSEISSESIKHFYSVCEKFGISSASELETVLGDLKFPESSMKTSDVEKNPAATAVLPVQKIQFSEIEESDMETISVALYLNEDFSLIASDDVRVEEYKSKLVAELAVVLRTVRSCFEVRGLFEGVVAEIFVRRDSGGRDSRLPSEIADELSKLVASKSVVLEGTEILHKANNVKVRGFASKARPLAFLMKNLKEKIQKSSSRQIYEVDSQASIKNDVDKLAEALHGLGAGKTHSLIHPIQPLPQPADYNGHKRYSCIVQATKEFSGATDMGQLHLSPGMKLKIHSTNGSGWCFGNILGESAEILYPGGWFPSEFVIRSEDESVSEFTLDSSSSASEDSLNESEILTYQATSFDHCHSSSPAKFSNMKGSFEMKNCILRLPLPPGECIAGQKQFSLEQGLQGFTSIRLEIVEGLSFPNAQTIGLLPDTYVAVSLLCEDQCKENMILDHLIGSEETVVTSLIRGQPIFRIPPQAKTSVAERTKAPHWGESFAFSKSRPQFFVMHDEKYGPKLVSSALDADVQSNKFVVLVTVHERNLFGPDVWVARAVFHPCPLTVGANQTDAWLTLCLMDGTPVVDVENAVARLRIKIEYLYHQEKGSQKGECGFLNDEIVPTRKNQPLEAIISESDEVINKIFLKHETTSTDDEESISKDFQLVPMLARKAVGLGPALRARISKSRKGSNSGTKKHIENKCPVLVSYSPESSICEIFEPSVVGALSHSNMGGEFEATEVEASFQVLSSLVEINWISASNLRKNPANGMNPSPYICISLISSNILHHINAGLLNHPMQSLIHLNSSKDYFEIHHQYRSCVVHHSQVPSWKSKLFLNECVDVPNIRNLQNSAAFSSGMVTKQLTGQAISMLISVYDCCAVAPDRFLGKVLLSFGVVGKALDQKFNFLDLDGCSMDSSHGYLHIQCRYRAMSVEPERVSLINGIHREMNDLDLSATTSSSYFSESSQSAVSSPRQDSPQENSLFNNDFKTFQQQYLGTGRSNNSTVPNTARSEETECSVLKTARSMETVSEVFEPVSSLIHGNSFESEHWLKHGLPSNFENIESFHKAVHIPFKPNFFSKEVNGSIPNANLFPMQSVGESQDFCCFDDSLMSRSEGQGPNWMQEVLLKIPLAKEENFSTELCGPSIRRAVSDQYIQSPATKILPHLSAKCQTTAVLGSAHMQKGLEDQIKRSQSVGGRPQFIKEKQDVETLTELQKAFMARKLIPARDQTDY